MKEDSYRKKTIRTFPLARILSWLLIIEFGLFAIVISLLIQSSLKSDFAKIRGQDFDRRMQAYETLLDNFVQVHSNLLHDISLNSLFTQSVMQPHAMKANLRDHMARVRVLGEPAQLSLLAFNGATIHSSMVAPDFDYRTKPWAIQLAAGAIEEYFGINKIDDSYFLTFGTKIEYNGRTEGALLMEIPAETLATNYHWSEDIEHEQLRIYHNDKLIITLGPESLGDQPPPDHRLEMAKYGLTLIGRLDDSDLEAINKEILQQLVVTIFLLALAGIATTIFFSHKMFIRPLENLRQVAGYVANGKFRRRQARGRNADEFPDGFRLREISNLRNDIVSMMEAIITREEALKVANSDLEERVKIRTEALEIARDDAMAANRAKSSFLAVMSHEIRTPMNAVLGILGLLGEQSLNREQRDLVKTGRQSGELLLTIINDILDFSKMEADKLELEEEPFDLHDLLTQTMELMTGTVGNRHLALKLNIDDTLPRYVEGDSCRLRQVLINLVGNAIKFTNEGSVVLEASQETSSDGSIELHCSIQDTGIGIPEDQQQALFEEFSMLDQSHSRTHEGTGLGLAISKRLVSMMGGNIGVTSQPGVGSRFFFHINLNKADAMGLQQAEDENALPAPSSNTRILLAEDNPANQKVIKAMLETAGLHVDIANNGLAAIDKVNQKPYDIVLMDISMPQMDGMTATQAIRAMSGDVAKTPIVALTAHTLSGDREHFLASGMDDYLTKPLNKAAALRCISRWTAAVAENDSGGTLQRPPEQLNSDAPENCVDEAILQQLVRDTDAEIVPELLLGYIEDAQERLLKIRDALYSQDAKTLEFEVHTLGSSAAAHGNPALHKLSRNIEELCREGQFESAFDKTSTVFALAERSLKELEERAHQGFTSDQSI